MTQADEAVSVWTVVGLLVAIFGADLATNRFEPPHSGLALKAAFLVVLLFWARRFARIAWDEMGLSRGTVRAGLRLGLLAALVIGVAIVVLALISGTHTYFKSGHVLRDSATSRILQPLVVIPLGTVIFEETIFRGVLLAVLLRRWSRRVAIVVSSLAFGIWHVIPLRSITHVHGAASAIGLVAVTAVAGVLFAMLRLRSGSLLAPILAHVATNSFAYVAAVVIITV